MRTEGPERHILGNKSCYFNDLYGVSHVIFFDRNSKPRYIEPMAVGCAPGLFAKDGNAILLACSRILLMRSVVARPLEEHAK